MTSSTKPEVHNISQRHQRRTGQRPQSTCSENLAKFSRYASGQTDILITIHRSSHTSVRRSNEKFRSKSSETSQNLDLDQWRSASCGPNLYP